MKVAVKFTSVSAGTRVEILTEDEIPFKFPYLLWWIRSTKEPSPCL